MLWWKKWEIFWDDLSGEQDLCTSKGITDLNVMHVLWSKRHPFLNHNSYMEIGNEIQ